MALLSLIVGSTEIDLLNGGDGYTLRLDGWEPQMTSRTGNEYDRVTEVITLKATGSSGADLASKITADIEDTIHFINTHINDPVTPKLAFLRWRWPGQSRTEERQALIYDMSYKLGSSPFFPTASNHSTFINLTLIIERAPYWEGVTGIPKLLEGILTGGDKQECTLAYGTVPGRISDLSVTGNATITEYWAGFRTDRYGDKTDLEPVWSFDNVTTTNDATASGGTVSWTSGDTDLLERMRIKMSQVSNITSIKRPAQRGVFSVLLRARSTGTETFNVRLSSGFTSTSSQENWNTHSRVKVSGDKFLFYPLGTITIPPLPMRLFEAATRSLLEYYTLRLEAEVNTAGTGNFEATRFVLIPQDEGFVHVKGISSASNARNYIKNDWLGWAAYTLASNGVITPTEFDIVNFAIPPDPWVVVFAGHHETNGQSLSSGDYSNLYFSWYPRFFITKS